MNRKNQKTSIKHCIALILCAALFISVTETNPTEVQAGQETQQAEVPEQLFHVRQTVTENGRIIYQRTDSDIMQIKDAFLYELENAEAVHRQKKSEGAEFISSDTIYSSEEYAMTATKNRYSGTLVAEQDIQISGNTSKLDNSSIYSKNGDILISGHTVEIHGIVYAPLGSVKINCETMILKGVLIADSAEINAGNCQYQPDETILQNVKRMAEYQVDSHADITMYYDNEKNKIGIEEIAGKDIFLYTRYGNGAFQLQENYTNGTLFDLPDKGEYFEAYAKFTDPYGEQKLSDIETFGSTEEGIYGPMTQDKDKDGIPDGYEVRDGLGDPSKRDSEWPTDSAISSNIMKSTKKHAFLRMTKFYMSGNMATKNPIIC